MKNEYTLELCQNHSNDQKKMDPQSQIAIVCKKLGADNFVEGSAAKCFCPPQNQTAI